MSEEREEIIVTEELFVELNDIFELVMLRMVIERFLRIEDVDDRRRQFCNFMNTSDQDMNNVLREVLKCKSLIPRADNTDYFVKYALKHRSLKIVKLLAANNLNIHEFFFEDGTSALHYLAESSERDYNVHGETMKLIRFIVKESEKNLSDEHGYTYFHGACMAGDEETVRRFVSQGVDVDLDTWKDSPLHIAAQYRRKEIVQILLENGANPNRLDRERSTPLHALARQRVCDFVECYTGNIDSIEKRSVDAIVDLLVAKGANIEARNKDENTPLSLAVSRFDVDVTRSLLKHGASLDGINEHNIFSCNFEPLQLKNYPWTWKMIEVMQLLQSAGYKMSLLARYRMLKCWLKVRGINDTEHLIPYFTNNEDEHMPRYVLITEMLYIREKFGFFMKQEVLDYLREQKENMELTQNIDPTEYQLSREKDNAWKLQAAKLNDIKLNDDTSLYQLCQMDYHEGHLVWKKMNNWLVPSLPKLSPYWDIIFKRHIANILIRQQLELFVADLFMTDYCKLKLPHTVCRIVAEQMTREELFRLCEQTDEEHISPRNSVPEKQ